MTTNRADRFVTHRPADYDAYKAQMNANDQDPAQLRRTIAALEKLGPAYKKELDEVRAKLQRLTGSSS